MNWDDMRYFLALARSGAIRPASRQLGVSHSTVARRIQLFEDQLGVRLFDRTPDGFVMTEAGEKMLQTAQEIESSVSALGREIIGGDTRLEGSICLTLPDALSHSPLMEDISSFLEEYPGVELELSERSVFSDLSRREADIAIRFVPIGQSPPPHLIGRKLANAFHGVYMAKTGLQRPHEPTLLGWGKESEGWNATHPVPKVPIRHHIPSTLGQREACAAGMGYAVLPCFQGDLDTRLQRVPNTQIWPSRAIWILTHADLVETKRMRLFRQELAQAIVKKRALFEGHNGTE